MRVPDTSRPSAAGDAPLPDLVDAYRARRDVLEAEMRELNRRRDEIRAAAEHEARDIVEAARRDVQRTLTTARQQLIVLAGQVQAAMEPLQPAGVRERTRFQIEESLPPGTLDIEEEPFDLDVLVNARHDVHAIFEESRPELEGFQDAVRALGCGTTPDLSSQGDPFEFPSEFAEVAARASPIAPPAPSPPPASSRPSPLVERPVSEAIAAPPAPANAPAGDTAPDPVLPAPAWDSDAPAPPAGRFAEGLAQPVHRPGVLAWVRSHPSAGWVAAILALTLLLGWWSRRSVDPLGAVGPEALALEADAPGPGEGTTDGSALPGTTVPAPAIRLEARREVWVQVTVDGRQDAGRTLQPGERHDIASARDVEIHAGDAGAVWISVLGGAPEALGADGRVLRRRLPVTPLPAASEPQARRDRADAPPAANAAGPSTATSARAIPVSGSNLTRHADSVAPAASRADRPPSPGAAPEAQIVTAAERWFDTYYRRLPFDAFGSVQQPVVADSRAAEARLPQGLGETAREFDQVQVQVVADTAIYSARMVERGQLGTGTARHEALVSQVWVRQGNGWHLMNVRLSSEPRGR